MAGRKIETDRRRSDGDDSSYRIDDLDRKIINLDKRLDSEFKRFDDFGKRFDDIKWVVGGTSAIFAVIFSVLTLISGWNYKSERESLRDFQKEIKELVVRSDDTRIELQKENGVDLAGSDLTVNVSNSSRKGGDGPGKRMVFTFIIKNIGDNTTGPMNFKLYFVDIETTIKSSDESQYKYEDYVNQNTLDPNSVPSKMSVYFELSIDQDYVNKIPEGRHPVMLKAYYGKGKVSTAKFFAVIAGTSPAN